MSYAQPRDSPATGSSLTSVGINWGWHGYSNCVQIESGHCYLHNREHSSGEITRNAFVSLFLITFFFKKGTILLRSKIQGHSMYAFVQCAHQSMVFRSFLVTNEFRCTEDSAVPQGFRPVLPCCIQARGMLMEGLEGGYRRYRCKIEREWCWACVSERERECGWVCGHLCVWGVSMATCQGCVWSREIERGREKDETRRKLSLVKGWGGNEIS